MNTDDLIERLGRGASAVERLPAPGRRAASWLIGSAAYVIGFAAIKALAMPSWEPVVTPLWLLQQGASLLVAITAARAALLSVIPGASPRAWGPVIVSAALWFALQIGEAVLDMRAVGTLGLGSETDWPCVASMAMGGIVLGGPLVWMLRRGAPLTPTATACLAGLAALSVANIEACLTRTHLFATTVLLWHGVTAAIVALVFAAMGRRWLRWPNLAR